MSAHDQAAGDLELAERLAERTPVPAEQWADVIALTNRGATPTAINPAEVDRLRFVARVLRDAANAVDHVEEEEVLLEDAQLLEALAARAEARP